MSQRTYPDRGLHGWVVHEIGLRIVSGRLAPGDVLPNEADLGSELEVSRSVLREAIKVLAGKGLVEVRTKTGTRVRHRRYWHLLDPDVLGWQFEEATRPDDLYDLMELRSIVEPAAARLAAERRTDEELATMAACYAEMEANVADPAGFVAADLKLHTTIFEASHNEFLEHMNDIIGVALRAARPYHTRHPERYVNSVPLHEAVLLAIGAGEPQTAEMAMADLIEGARRDLDHYLRVSGR